MRRLALLGLALIAACTAVYAAAASLGTIQDGTLGAGNGVVVACDNDGFSVSYTTSGGNVTQVTLDGINDPGCEGGRLSLTLTDGSGSSIGQAGPTMVPTDGDSLDQQMTLNVSPQPSAEAVQGIHVVVEGP